MPKYVVRLTSAGEPVGIHTPSQSYYLPDYEHLEPVGKRVLGLPSSGVSWDTFADHVASSSGHFMKWDTVNVNSYDLADALEEVRNRVETFGDE